MTAPSLIDAVRQAIGAPVAELGDPVREELSYDAFLAGRSLARLRGVARTAHGDVPWSLIEKVTQGPAIASPYLYDNGRREYLAYGSDLLRDLAPAVAAPAAFGRSEGPDGRLTLWLEELVGPDVRRPGEHDIVATARDLGRLAGRWLGRMPDADWLFTGWIERHAQSAAMGPAVERLRTLQRREEVEERIGRPIDAALALIAAQPVVRQVLESLPVTLCHHDAVAANVFVRDRDSGRETVLIDWESLGPGTVGADLASLLFSSVRRGDLSSGVVGALVEPAIQAYADGMHDAGQSVTREMVHRAFDAAVALRWTLVRDVAMTIEGGGATFRGSAPDEAPAESLRQLVDLTGLLFAAADRLRLQG